MACCQPKGNVRCIRSLRVNPEKLAFCPDGNVAIVGEPVERRVVVLLRQVISVQVASEVLKYWPFLARAQILDEQDRLRAKPPDEGDGFSVW